MRLNSKKCTESIMKEAQVTPTDFKWCFWNCDGTCSTNCALGCSWNCSDHCGQEFSWV